MGITDSFGATIFSAKAPIPVIANTLSPSLRLSTPSPTFSIIPAASPPGVKGSGG
jgi:hypothetical protein